MYKKHFGLRRLPFSIAPDPRYLYMSEQHREALAHLLFGVKNEGGFVLLTGEVWTGKTTICRCLLDKLPKKCDVAFIINPKLSVSELLATICDEFRIRYPKKNATVKLFVDRINEYLLQSHAKRRKALLIIDEAQNLSDEVLEQIRLLTNLETNDRKLLQIILLGQPELRTKLARPELKQLAQRIVARFHLGPLSNNDVAVYVRHRLSLAGIHRDLFSPPGLHRLYDLSGGIPRVVNAICDRALLGTYVQGKHYVDAATIVRAAHEVLGASRQKPYLKIATLVLAGLALFAAGALLAFMTYRSFNSPIAVLEKKPEQPALSRPVPVPDRQAQSGPAEENPAKDESSNAQAPKTDAVTESGDSPVEPPAPDR